MAERLKDRFFTDASVKAFAKVVKRHYPAFDDKKFVRDLTSDAFRGLELMQMARRATESMARLLPKSYKRALRILLEVAPDAEGMETFCLPTFVELYGLDDWDTSLPAMALITKYASCEFAIRPFLLKDPDRAMAFLGELAEDEDPKVRRLASEGCRPRLPWAVALPQFKKDPSPILPILEKLMDDDSESVRTSVANNLNDISKDHPKLVLDVCERWQGTSKDTDRIIKRACRTMLKAGDTRALRLFGFGDPKSLDVKQLRLSKKTAAIGDSLRFSFVLMVAGRRASKVRLEYVVGYVKATGKTSNKVFQIKEDTLAPGEHEVSRKLSFADQSTRKHHPGKHRISIVVNGVVKAETEVALRARA
ncbi:MAG: DNA alkylation repair protein [Gemmatimonadales bacterium]|jgi:3-methyladenine DNA glycosylase AlkC